MRTLSARVDLTPEQLKVIGDVRPGFRIIRGAAGSGKTTTALRQLGQQADMRLDRRHRYGHDSPVRALVLTFNRTLEGYIAEVVRRYVPDDDALELEVTTFGRWARSLVENIRILDESEVEELLQPHLMRLRWTSPGTRGHHQFFVDEVKYVLGRFEPRRLDNYLAAVREGRGTAPRVDRRLRTALLEAVLRPYAAAKHKSGVIDWNDLAVRAASAEPDLLYDIVVVDEAQDFSNNQVRAVLRHLQPSHNTTFVIDAIQRIYPRYLKWSEVGVTARPEIIHTLRENYRNTAAIARFARPLVAGLPTEDDGTLPNFEACDRPGTVPLVVAGRYGAQLRFMLNRLNATVETSEELIALLHPRGWFGEARKQLGTRGIPFCELTRNNEWPSGPETVALSTIHSAKGLEFDHVLIPGLDRKPTQHGPEPGDANLDRLRRLLAMAISRARMSVMIGYMPGKESSLIGLLDPSTYDLVEV